MADNLIFPIGFDLEKAVNEAGQQWDKKYAKNLEDYINKRPIKVNLDFENLTDVKARLAQLKIEPITPETKAAIKDLARELQVLAKALEQVQKYSSRSAGTAEVRGAKVSEIEAKASAARELARQRAAKAEQAELKLAAAREKSAVAANKATTAVDSLTNAYGNQTYYIERLLKKMVAVWSVQQVQSFLTNIREVTAQFELQRVSLGAIIQDQNRANQLFSEIKSFSLKSPVSILDLTKYTKQLAAYKIGVDELFDTTKKLTDVSVGLGVSMDRVVLAYGQTRATGYLRASEIRQFTEMGVPIVEELAAKLSKMNGELVTAAQVMDMVSKRGISFELVKEVFDDMTSAGGMFYNMQEKQGNTLFGLWAKLGDAASVMYDQIGNTESVNSGMKTAIGLLTELMRNWKAVANTAQYFILPNAAIFALYKYSTATQRVEAAQSAAAAATERRKAAVLQLATLNEKATVDEINAAWATLQKAKADEEAAQKATTRMGLLKSGFASVAKSISAGLGVGLAITAVTTLVYKLFEAYENAHRLDRKLDEIDAERITLTSQSVRNFEYLADVAVNAADGSKKQKDALDELHRTYKDMIPVQDLTIEHLRQLREGTNNVSEAYKSLTTAIREYISEQQKQKKLSAIEEEYGSTITDKYKKLYSKLTQGIKINVGGRKVKSWVELQFSPEEFERAMVEFEKRATDKTKSVGQKIKESFAAIGFDLTPGQIKALQQVGKWGEFDDGYFITLNNALEEQAERINAVHTGYAGFVGDLGKYGAEMSRIADVMENKIYKANGKVLESNSFLRKQMQSNEWIKEWTNSLKTNLSAAGVEVKNEWFNFIKNLNPSEPNTISSINFDAILEALNTDAIREKLGEHYEQTKNYVLAIQKEYQDLLPQNRTVAAMRSRLMQIGNNVDKTGNIMNDLQRHLMKTGDNWEDYSKSVRDAVKDYEAQIDEMQKINVSIKNGEKGVGPLDPSKYSDEEIKKVQLLVEALKQLFPFLAPEKSSNSGRQSDPRLQNLKEEISLTKKLYDEYQKLEKQIGATKAAEKIQEIYKNTISTLEGRAEKYDFEFKLPFTDENLKANMQHFIDKMKELQGLKDKKGKPLFPNIGKEIDEAVAQLEDVDLNSLQKALEKKLKELADRISRTKTAKEFYEKILSQTGDVELAANVTFSIYGEDGKDLKEAIADQVRGLTNGLKLPDNIISADNSIDYKALQKWAKANEKELGGMYAELIKISNDGQKELAKIAEQGAKLLLSYDEIAQKRVNIEQEASEKIRQLREAEALYLASQATEEQKAAYSKRTNKAVQGIEAKRDLDLLKLKDEYMRFFSAIHSLTKKEAETLRGQVRQALFKAFQDGAISADELKRELKAIDEQFRKLTQDSGKFMDYLEGGFDGLINRLRTMADEMMSVGSEIGKMDSVDQISEGQKNFIDTMLKQFGNDATGNNFASLLSNTNGDLSKMGDLLQGISGEMGAMAEGGASTLALVDRIITDVARTIEGIAAIRDQLNEMRSEDNQLEGGFWDAFEYLENFNKYAAQGWEALKSGNVVGAVQNTIQSIISIFGTAQAQRVRRANKEIKRQQELLDQLEYTYGRLEKAAEKAFGADYLNNYNQQLKVLQAQQAAYLKQAEAERRKGKKEDKEKTKEYLNNARDIADQIADMQNNLSARFLGSDITSAARDFASAWLDAYKEFGNTADAMSKKFQEMIQNMIAESLIAQVMKRALQPAFEMIDNMEDADFYSQSFWARLQNEATIGARNADVGAQTVMKFLEQSGIKMRELGGELTGISRDIAGASEESINGLAMHMHTVEWYVAQINQNVAIMAGRAAGSEPVASDIDWRYWQSEALNHLAATAQNTAETVSECKKIASECHNIAVDVHRVMGEKNGKFAIRTIITG